MTINSMPRGLPQAHPAAELFPLMCEEELNALSDDIREHGQRHPIVMTEGKILDGRNRFLACVMAHKKPWIEQWDGQGNPVTYVLSANLQRRHLTPTQKAAIAANALPLFEEEAKKRMVEGGRVGGSQPKGSTDSVLPLPKRQDPSKRAIAQAAKAVGAGRDATAALVAIKKTAPEVFERVKAGELSISRAKRKAGLETPRPRPRAKPAPVTATATPPTTSPSVAPAPTSATSAPPSAAQPIAPENIAYDRALAAVRALRREDQRRLCRAVLAELEEKAHEPRAG